MEKDKESRKDSKELDPCVEPQSPESSRPTEQEDACDDGTK